MTRIDASLDGLDVNGVSQNGSDHCVFLDLANYVDDTHLTNNIYTHKMSTSTLEYRESPFSKLPSHLTAESPDNEIFSYLKKLRPAVENQWWNELFNPTNAIAKVREAAWTALFPRDDSSTSQKPSKRKHSSSDPQLPSKSSRQERSKLKDHSNLKQEPADLEEGEIAEGQLVESSPDEIVGLEESQPTGTGPIQASNEEQPRAYSQNHISLKNTRTMLNRVDMVLWKAYKTTYICDGRTTINDSDFCLPKMRAADFLRLFKQHRSAPFASEKLGFGSLDSLTALDPNNLIALPNIPLTILDNDGIPLVFHLPQYYSENQTEKFTNLLLSFGRKAKLDRKQADANGRGDPSSYVIRRGHLAGCINLASSWVSLGQTRTEPRPSEAMISGAKGGTVHAFTMIQQHFDNIRTFNLLMNYALRVLDHRSFWQHFDLKCRLQERNPGCRPFAANDPSIATGRSYIFNRSTTVHFDMKEHAAAWSPLQVLGTCTTGFLALPQLGIKLPYLPGTLTFIRGHFLAHGVTGWDGTGDRICLANFNHQTEWEHAEVEPRLYG